MTWYTLNEKEPPKNEDVLLICLAMDQKRYGRTVYRCTVGKYSSGLEWWDIPWTQVKPVLWSPIDAHPAFEKLEAMEKAEEKEAAEAKL